MNFVDIDHTWDRTWRVSGGGAVRAAGRRRPADSARAGYDAACHPHRAARAGGPDRDVHARHRAGLRRRGHGCRRWCRSARRSTAAITPRTSSITARGRAARSPPSNPLPLGENKLTIELADRAGNIGRAESTFINAGGGWLTAVADPGVGSAPARRARARRVRQHEREAARQHAHGRRQGGRQEPDHGAARRDAPRPAGVQGLRQHRVADSDREGGQAGVRRDGGGDRAQGRHADRGLAAAVVRGAREAAGCRAGVGAGDRRRRELQRGDQGRRGAGEGAVDQGDRHQLRHQGTDDRRPAAEARGS